MDDKFSEYSEVISRLVGEAIACTPQEWTQGTLTIDCDGRRIDYKLKNEIQPGKAVISDRLRGLIDEFYLSMRDQGEAWTQAIVDFHQEGDGFKFSTSFTYADSTASDRVQVTEAPAKKRPWWKFGAGRT